MNLPNAISLARLCAVPMIIWLILSGNMYAAFWVTFVVAISDAIDGIIAKSFNKITVLGSYLDPLADKVLLVSVYLALGYAGHLPSWLIILVVFRDFVIVGGVLFLHVMITALEMRPNLLSKFNTLAQLVLAVGILAAEGLGIESLGFLDAMVYLVAITTFLSGSVYIGVWIRKTADIK